MLEMGNPECRELAGGLRLIPGGVETLRMIENLDFEQAAVSLTGLRAKL